MAETIRVAHSPDSDDAFMFWALAAGKIDTGCLEFVHELQDIETLNRRALAGELEVTAVSIHAYAHLSDRYVLLPHGASMGEGYGPRIVAREPLRPDQLADRTVAVNPAMVPYLDLWPLPGPNAVDLGDGTAREQIVSLEPTDEDFEPTSEPMSIGG